MKKGGGPKATPFSQLIGTAVTTQLLSVSDNNVDGSDRVNRGATCSGAGEHGCGAVTGTTVDVTRGCSYGRCPDLGASCRSRGKGQSKADNVALVGCTERVGGLGDVDTRDRALAVTSNAGSNRPGFAKCVTANGGQSSEDNSPDDAPLCLLRSKHGFSLPGFHGARRCGGSHKTSAELQGSLIQRVR